MASAGPAQTLTPRQAAEVQKALGLQRAGNARAALEVARALAAAAPRAPDAQQLLAMCLADAGANVDAEQAFRQALVLAPDHPLILVNFATWLRRLGRRDEALAMLGRATAVAPGMAKAWIEQGITAFDAGDHALACAALRRGVALQPDAARAWHALGNAEHAMGDYEAAEVSLQRAVEIAPRQASAWISLGAVQRLQGRAGPALESLRRAGEAGFRGPELGDALAGTLLDEGRVEESLRAARDVVRAHPDFVPGHVTLAHLLWEYGPAVAPGEDAIATFRAALAARPGDFRLRLAFAGFLLTAARPDEALVEVRRLRAEGDAPLLVAVEANALQAAGRTAEAGALFAQVHHALGDADPAFRNAYVRHLLTAGRPDEAAARALEATRRKPDDQEAWAYLGTAWRILGDPREAWLCDYQRFVAEIDVVPPDGFADRDSFLAALRAALEPLHQARREPVQQSLRGGSQTSGRLFGRPEPAIAAAQQALRRAVEAWIATLPDDPSHPFLRRRAPTIRFSGSWSVRLWSAGKHINHIHPEGWMSSAFYVALPSSLGAAQADGAPAGYLQFGQPPVELGLALPPRRVLRPEPGRLALFPSYFWHGTVPFDDAQPRLTVAFDMVPAARAG